MAFRVLYVIKQETMVHKKYVYRLSQACFILTITDLIMR